MEAEVRALMGVEDEALWNSVGLFTSDEELRALARGGGKVTSVEFSTSDRGWYKS
jgi:hypothetical protein